MLKIALCDDDPAFLENMAQLLDRWSEQRRIPAEIYRFGNGDDLISKSAIARMDVIFLDIIMPLLNGMDTARELRQKDNGVRLVFLTSSPEFALESYEVKANGYLLKPVTYDRIKECMDDFARELETEPKSLMLRTAFGYQKLYFHDIEYAEAQNKKVTFHLRAGRTVDAVEPLYSFADKFTCDNGFFKCHRSYFVYLPNVDRFSSASIIMKSGQSVPIARGYAKAFKEAYFDMMFRE